MTPQLVSRAWGQPATKIRTTTGNDTIYSHVNVCIYIDIPNSLCKASAAAPLHGAAHLAPLLLSLGRLAVPRDGRPLHHQGWHLPGAYLCRDPLV